MDFAALMSKELGKSKKPSDSDNTSKKYMKRADVEAERRAAYLEEQKALEEERQAKVAAKRKREEEAAAEKEAREEKRRKLAEESRRRREDQEWEEEQARRRRLGLPEKVRGSSEEANEDGEGAEDIPEEELVVKLREIGQPVVLFGEGHAARVRRYQKLTTVVTDGPIPTTLEPVDEKDMKVEGTMPKTKEGRKWLYRQLASYFTMVLTAYQQAMEAEKQDTAASRNAYNAMVQTRENLKPVSLLGNPHCWHR